MFYPDDAWALYVAHDKCDDPYNWEEPTKFEEFIEAV